MLGYEQCIKNILEPAGAFLIESYKFLLVIGLEYCYCGGLGVR